MKELNTPLRHEQYSQELQSQGRVRNVEFCMLHGVTRSSNQIVTCETIVTVDNSSNHLSLDIPKLADNRIFYMILLMILYAD